MENLKISETTREKIEEAAVSVFMDQYAAALDAGIDKKMADCADMEFPPELDRRCRALIQQEYKKQRSKKYRKAALRVLRSVAVVAIALLSLCSLLFMTVEAFRIPVINFFAEKHEGHLELRGTAAENEIPETFNPDDPLAGILSDAYTLSSISNNWEMGTVAASYHNSDGSDVFFSIAPAGSTTLVDDEDAATYHFRLMDHDAYLLSEGENIRLIWLDANAEQVFTLCGSKIPEETVLSLAEMIVLMFH